MAERSLPAQLRNRDSTRRRAYRDNLAFYNGAQWPPARLDRVPRRLTFNYTKPIIHKVTASLMQGRTTVVRPADDTDAAREHADRIEVAIHQVEEQNQLDQLDFDTELDTAVLGDGAFKVWWDGERVRISSPDPSGIFVWTWPDDITLIWRVAHQYQLDADSAHTTLALDADLARAIHPTRGNIITDVWERDTLQRWVNDTPGPIAPNPYGLIPFVVFPNIREPKTYWGTSDVPALIEPQRELNRALSQWSRIMELSGNPIAVLEGVTDSDDIAVVPGAIWEMPEKSKAYLLDLLKGGGVKLHVDYLDAIYRALYDMGETPRSAFGGVERQISGVAMELDLDPLIKKVERKRRLRTDAYQQRNDIILAILAQNAGGPTLDGAAHTMAWGNILPTDREREVREEVALVGAAIHSRRTATDNLGGIDDPDAEFTRWLDEQRDIGPDASRAPGT